MWEYTGTGWMVYLGQTKPIPDEEKQYTAVRDEDPKKNDLDLAPARADEQHLRLRVTKEVAEEVRASPSCRS